MNICPVLALVASIIEPDFYLQMRTNQQLGYIVWSFSQRLEDRLFMRFIIQSATHGPFELSRRVETWLQKSGGLFDNLTDEEFERHRKSLIVSLEKETDSIAEETERLYYLATEEKGNFKMKKQLAAVVKKVSKEEVVYAAKKLFQDSTTPRVVVQIRSKDNGDLVPAETFEKIEEVKDRIKG